MPLSSFLPEPTQVVTVLGPVAAAHIGITDAHTHVWIDAVDGAEPGSPTLVDYPAIRAELIEYRQAGGSTVVDCQPGGCGRNGMQLMRLSQESAVHIVACTGYHRKRYYAPDFWLWQASADQAADYFLAEIEIGLTETRSLDQPARAGFIKIACEATLAQTPQHVLDGAAHAAAESGVAIEIHTERGGDAENILAFFTERDVSPRQLVLCHMDKRPDAGLHRELAQAGALLEYDTFYRPKYQPDAQAWPLIRTMLNAGLEASLAFATDIAEQALWKHPGGGPGLPGFLTTILPRCKAMGIEPPQLELIFGKNIARRLSLRTSQIS